MNARPDTLHLYLHREFFERAMTGTMQVEYQSRTLYRRCLKEGADTARGCPVTPARLMAPAAKAKNRAVD